MQNQNMCGKVHRLWYLFIYVNCKTKLGYSNTCNWSFEYAIFMQNCFMKNAHSWNKSMDSDYTNATINQSQNTIISYPPPSHKIAIIVIDTSQIWSGYKITLSNMQWIWVIISWSLVPTLFHISAFVVNLHPSLIPKLHLSKLNFFWIQIIKLKQSARGNIHIIPVTVKWQSYNIKLNLRKLSKWINYFMNFVFKIWVKLLFSLSKNSVVILYWY